MAVLITGNTFPVKDQLKALGGKWNAEKKGWEVPVDKESEAKALVANAPKDTKKKPFVHHKCKVCGHIPTGRYGDVIYRSGECRDCYEERKMGY